GRGGRGRTRGDDRPPGGVPRARVRRPGEGKAAVLPNRARRRRAGPGGGDTDLHGGRAYEPRRPARVLDHDRRVPGSSRNRRRRGRRGRVGGVAVVVAPPPGPDRCGRGSAGGRRGPPAPETP